MNAEENHMRRRRSIEKGSGTIVAPTTRLTERNSPREQAQTPVWDFACAVRADIGEAERRLRNLQAEVQAHAVRRPLPRDRQGARPALHEMQLRPWIVPRRPEPHRGGDGLSQSRARPADGPWELQAKRKIRAID